MTLDQFKHTQRENKRGGLIQPIGKLIWLCADDNRYEPFQF